MKTILQKLKIHFEETDTKAIIAFPENENQLLLLSKTFEANQYELGVTHGSKTDESLLNTNLLYINFKNLNKIKNFSIDNLTITVQAGVLFSQLQQHIQASNLMPALFCFGNHQIFDAITGKAAIQWYSSANGTADFVNNITLALKSGEFSSANNSPRRATGPDFFHSSIGFKKGLGIPVSFGIKLIKHFAKKTIIIENSDILLLLNAMKKIMAVLKSRYFIFDFFISEKQNLFMFSWDSSLNWFEPDLYFKNFQISESSDNFNNPFIKIASTVTPETKFLFWSDLFANKAKINIPKIIKNSDNIIRFSRPSEQGVWLDIFGTHKLKLSARAYLLKQHKNGLLRSN